MVDNDNKGSNFDQSELDKFNDLASRWWDKTGDFRPLHDMNPIRTDYINNKAIEWIGGDVSGKKILDVGCGGGILTESLSKLGAKVDGIDMAEAALSVAKLHLFESELDINYYSSSVEEYAEENAEQYDVVTCLEMLEHVPDPASVMKACAKLVKPGGLLFFSTINRNPKSYVMAIIGAEYVLKLLPKGTHEYNKFIKPSEMDRYARMADIELKHLTGIHYNPFTKHFHLGKGLDVNYIACYQK